jgi:hypothetical protein
MSAVCRRLVQIFQKKSPRITEKIDGPYYIMAGPEEVVARKHTDWLNKGSDQSCVNVHRFS